MLKEVLGLSSEFRLPAVDEWVLYKYGDIACAVEEWQCSFRTWRETRQTGTCVAHEAEGGRDPRNAGYRYIL